MEDLSADNQILSALCELTECDIRSCLNTLQFARRKSSYVSTDLLTSTSVGHKDIAKNLFESWKDIFQIKSTRAVQRKSLTRIINKKFQEDKALVDVLGYSFQEEPYEAKTVFQSLLDSLEVIEDMEKFIEGCFENYPNVHYNDPMLQKTSSCLEWMEMFDLVQHQTIYSHQYELMRYLIGVPMAFYKYCASSGSSSASVLSFPKSEFEFHRKLAEMSWIVKSFLLELSPDIYRHLSERIVVMEFVSPFLDIISPNIRTLNSQLWNAKDRSELRLVIDSFLCYRLELKSYSDGNYLSYKLDPPLDKLTSYETLSNTNRHRNFSSHQMHLIAMELQKEINRREGAKRIIKSENGTTILKTEGPRDPKKFAVSSMSFPREPNEHTIVRKLVLLEMKSIVRSN